MTVTTYSYTVEGTAAGGSSWSTTGEVTLGPCRFMEALEEVMAKSFDQLTNGDAAFGDVASSEGPYAITKLIVNVVATAN